MQPRLFKTSGVLAAAVALALALVVATATNASAATPVQTGRAFGLAASGLVPIKAAGDTGPVATSGDSTVGPKCLVPVRTAIIQSGTACGTVYTGSHATSGDTRGSLAVATLDYTRVGIGALPVVEINGVFAFSGTQCTGTRGFGSVAQLKIGGTVINGTQLPAPNTTIPLGALGRIVLNEQLPVPGANQGLVVNAAHITVNGVEDIILGSATSAIHGCGV